jgi:cytoskeletal protein RodZ
MKNSRNLLFIAIITATLVMGTSVISMQSYGGEHKRTGDFKSSTMTSAEVDKKSAGQHQDQDNFCYRGDDCEQANEGQQIVGKDNEAKGFNDQSLNVQQAATATPTATPTATSNQPPNQNTTQPPTPTTTLNICKTVVNQAPEATFQPSDFTFTFSTLANPSTFQGNNEGCTAVTVAPGTFSFKEFWPPSVKAETFDTSGGCKGVNLTSPPPIITINGTIAAGETQTCTITNNVAQVNTQG